MEIILLVVLGYILLQTLYTGFYWHRSREFITTVYTSDQKLGSGPAYSMYVAGDSIATGVGASSFETSLVGRVATELARHHTVSVKNEAVNGLKIAQLAGLPDPESKPDLVFISISSNDLFNFKAPAKFALEARAVVARYSKQGKKVIIFGPGKVGSLGTPTPFIFKPLYYWYRLQYVRNWELATKGYDNVIYVDPSKNYDPSGYGPVTHPADRFHLSDEGHRYWATQIITAMKEYGIL
jgi:lysophospholipase L1-like esterase